MIAAPRRLHRPELVVHDLRLLPDDLVMLAERERLLALYCRPCMSGISCS